MGSPHGHASEPKPRVAKRTSRQLYAAALTLPEDERANLACSLLESIEGDEPGRSPSRDSWEAAWATEIGHRLAAMDAGRPGVPVADALAALRQPK